MSGTVIVKQFINRMPPAFSAEWNGWPLTIALDTSAMLKLGALDPERDPETTLASNERSVASAVERLLAMRAVAPSREGFTVTLSAIDLY